MVFELEPEPGLQFPGGGGVAGQGGGGAREGEKEREGSDCGREEPDVADEICKGLFFVGILDVGSIFSSRHCISARSVGVKRISGS